MDPCTPLHPPAEPPHCGTALLLIDLQNDFMEGGSLAVPDGSAVVPLANALRTARQWELIALSQDWHPANHASFAVNNPGAALFSTITLAGGGEQVMWPAHCVQGSRGAEFHSDLAHAPEDAIVQKGTIVGVDSYSAFGDANGHTQERTRLADLLRARGVADIWLCGLALDYCVAASARDAAKEGFRVTVVLPATRAIAPESTAREMAAMEEAGVVFVHSMEAALRMLARA